MENSISVWLSSPKRSPELREMKTNDVYPVTVAANLHDELVFTPVNLLHNSSYVDH